MKVPGLVDIIGRGNDVIRHAAQEEKFAVLFANALGMLPDPHAVARKSGREGKGNIGLVEREWLQAVIERMIAVVEVRRTIFGTTGCVMILWIYTGFAKFLSNPVGECRHDAEQHGSLLLLAACGVATCKPVARFL